MSGDISDHAWKQVWDGRPIAFPHIVNVRPILEFIKSFCRHFVCFARIDMMFGWICRARTIRPQEESDDRDYGEDTDDGREREVPRSRPCGSPQAPLRRRNLTPRR